MNVQCPHCGHEFIAGNADSLLMCHRCEQLFEPARGNVTQQPEKKKNAALEWTGGSLLAVGILGAVFVSVFAGAVVGVVGVGLMKAAR